MFGVRVLRHRVFLEYSVLPEHGRGFFLSTTCEAVRAPSPVRPALTERGAAASREVGGVGSGTFLLVTVCIETCAPDRLVGLGGRELEEFGRRSRADKKLLTSRAKLLPTMVLQPIHFSS